MSVLHFDKLYVVVGGGTSLRRAVEDAIIMSVENSCPVMFKFNGTDVCVEAEELLSKVLNKYDTDRKES